jgi:hypothetical protein
VKGCEVAGLSCRYDVGRAPSARWPQFPVSGESPVTDSKSPHVASTDAERRQRPDRRRYPRGGRRETDTTVSLTDAAARIEVEYRGSPAHRLTLEQAVRLWDMDAHVCARAMQSLVLRGSLTVTAAGEYVRLSESA